MKSKYRILAVDDDARNTDIMHRLLGSKYDLKTANSGEEALEVIQPFHPDLVLLDIVMTGIDGYETCRSIRGDARFRFTKIVLVSGQDSVEERLKGYEVGADDYVTKPFDFEELKAKVEVFLRLKRAEEVDQIKGDLLTLFSHETKTPLSGIIGLSELLKEDMSLGENARNCAGLIYQSGNQLLEFVRKTSFLCELKTGKKLLKRSEPVSDRVQKAIAATAKLLPPEGEAVYKTEIPEDLTVTADWDMLDMVLGYLLHNAAKFSQNGGPVQVSAKEEGGACVIRVEDQGAGIDPQWMHSIFDEFAVQDVTHHHRGQGLSLAIAKHVVELHDGAIRADSTPGKGSTFTIQMPI
ncbi:MAG: hybrid sensor histidine kinase/response regulator [Myxococcota bacterium]|nr:hybrid sensor histidine kinase/response regulator [Myxococcota bacterium]